MVKDDIISMNVLMFIMVIILLLQFDDYLETLHLKDQEWKKMQHDIFKKVNNQSSVARIGYRNMPATDKEFCEFLRMFLSADFKD